MSSAPALVRRFLSLALAGLALVSVVSTARAAVPTPPAPKSYFNDYANYIPVDRARALDARLAQFERDTSNQLVVAIYPRLPQGTALEDYTVRAAQAWGVGQKQRDNGAVLFVFVADRALRIEVGYGLEGSLTDAVAHSIIENELKPNLRAGRPAEALDAAVTAMMAATRGEYRGTGRTAADKYSTNTAADNPSSIGLILKGIFFIFIMIAVIISWIRDGFTFENPNRRSGSGGSWGGGSSGGGGFSGGGGSFGGGGASGKW